MVIQSRRQSLPADERIIAGGLQHKFASRIIDRHRANAGRTAAASAHHHATDIDILTEAPHSTYDVSDNAAARDELRRLLPLLSQLSDDQRRVIIYEATDAGSPSAFAAQNNWTMEKYRKTSQRSRARLRTLRDNPDQNVNQARAAHAASFPTPPRPRAPRPAAPAPAHHSPGGPTPDRDVSR